MNAGTVTQPTQLIAWLFALVELILALYVLLLNARHVANRHVSALLMVYTVISFASGLLSGAESADQAALPTRLLAATVMSVQPGILVTSVALLKPAWLRGRWRPAWWCVYGLVLLPAALTLIDLQLGTRLWYTGLDVEAYRGGFVFLFSYAQGSLALLVRSGLYGTFVPTVLFLLYVGWFDGRASRLERRLAWLLLGAEGTAVAMLIGLGNVGGPLPTTLVTNAVSMAVYVYAAFEPVVAGQRLHQGRLQFRLTALILAVTLPILLAVAGFVNVRTGALVDQVVAQQMRATHQALSASVLTWLDSSAALLERVVSSPEIVSMDAQRQEPLLKAVAEGSPYVFLAGTVDVAGMGVARSDGAAGQDYGNRAWFQQARDGSPPFLQVLISDVDGQPVLVQSMPIRDSSGRVVGVGMMASSLSDVARQVHVAQSDGGVVSYVVDASGQAIAHPDPVFSTELRSLASHPPVAALQQGGKGLVRYTDERGQAWRAYVEPLDNGWGVVVQWEAGQGASALKPFWRASLAALGAGAALLGVLTFLTIRQAFSPIHALTETATAIADGDLDRVAQVEGGDEIGVLARAFNTMTAQLRESIATLERIVAQRTQQLERHSAYLEAASQVASAAASILEPERLIELVVDRIREQFDLYYVGLFLVDEGDGWAILRAGTGDQGRIMLGRGHRIAIGEGMVGWCVANTQPRIAQDAELDSLRLATPELPATRSEAALPLRARGQVLGALTVQSHRRGAFDQDTVALLQTMADQVAVALENARLFAESQEALVAAQRAYGELSRQAWDELLRRRGVWGYRYARGAVHPLGDHGAEEVIESRQRGAPVMQRSTSGPKLVIPLKIRDQSVGVLRFRKDRADSEWTAEEIDLLETLAYQLGAALQNARFFQAAQSQAAQEELITEFSTRVRQTLDVESVIRAAVQEVRQALDLPEVIIRLAPEPSAELEGGGGAGV